jgi:SNF2 family DNA or RNA helicase
MSGPLLTDRRWRPRYDSDSDNLIESFYEPALKRAVRYDRATGYFSPAIFTLAFQGIEGLIQNRGRARLIVGCTLQLEEIEAIERGEKLKKVLADNLLSRPLDPADPREADALELLSWLIAREILEVKLALPCDRQRRPIPAAGIFHAKTGIIEDREGNRLAFTGSINETACGWTGNWESFHVFTDWGGTRDHVIDEENSFAELWADRAKRCLVVDVPTAVRDRLLQFLPASDRPPRRLEKITLDDEPPPVTPSPVEPFDPRALYRQVWSTIRFGPSVPGDGDRIGEVTSAITPYPHQIKAFYRLYRNWPPRLLIADEVGLGKTIQAGLLIRQAWLSGKAKRILIMAPKAVLKQWQIELREKFNLNIPIYDGKNLSWYDCRALRVLGKPLVQPVSRSDWHKEPLVITSSHLMRRSDRSKELTGEAEPYDLIILDEAHHARRQGVSGDSPKGPNRLLRLMRDLQHRAEGLVLLTATPMQVSPIEVWDLLNLLGMPAEWDLENFLRFFDRAGKENPSHADFEFMAGLFRSVERHFGETSLAEIRRYYPDRSGLALKKILSALRDEATAPRKQLSSERRAIAIEIMRRETPIKRLISRHTRELLRKYYDAGKITTPIATRYVSDEFVTLALAERALYTAVEDYIASTYNNARATEKNAVGFVMTIYRRRLASSFAALDRTLQQRIDRLENPDRRDQPLNIEDISDDDLAEDSLDDEEIERWERETLINEELQELKRLVYQIRELSTDTKTICLQRQIRALQSAGYRQIMVFTQYTDTMDFLRAYLTETGHGERVLCFSGRGGEISERGIWRVISREDIKKRFREGQADILLCTDAAAEGLNFQFCGALINYDMPWNPMRVEQRIGRIDRLGQVHAERGIQIINLHYENTVETDVYMALRERIGLFSRYVGKLQPILAILPRRFTSLTLSDRTEREVSRQNLIQDLETAIGSQDRNLDLDGITEEDLQEIPLGQPLYDLQTLDRLLHRADLLPEGSSAVAMQRDEYRFSMPGMDEPLRVTTNPDYFDRHSSSTELWSPGSPLFPCVAEVDSTTIVPLTNILSDY